MKSIFWNARGITYHDTRLVLKNMILNIKPDIIMIVEPWTEICNFPSSFWSKLNLKLFVYNNIDSLAPNLWCICNMELEPTVIVASA